MNQRDPGDAPILQDTPTIEQLEEAHSTAMTALAFTTHSVSKNNDGLMNAPREAIRLIDELAAEVGQARLDLDKARESLRSAVQIGEKGVTFWAKRGCPACQRVLDQEVPGNE
jgi:multidrug resistance efflux pump